MIRMRVVKPLTHFVVSADQPCTVEVIVVNGDLIAHVYDSVDTDQDSDPIGAFDATLGDANAPGWEFPPKAAGKGG